MNDLKELVTLLGKNNLPLDETKLGQRAHALFLYVRRVAQPTDEGAARKLKLKKGSSAFRKVKHKLKYALLDGITNVPNKPRPAKDRPTAALNCWSTIALARSSPQAYDSLPRPLIDHHIQQTQDFDLLEASSQLTDVLADRPTIGPDIVHYLERSDYLGALGGYMAELLESTFLILHLRNAQAPMEEVEKVAKKTLDRLLPMKEHFTYVLWHYHLYIHKINYHIARTEYYEILEISDIAIDYLSNYGASKTVKKYKTTFKIYKASSFLQLCKFDEGIKVLNELLIEIDSESRDYYRCQELTILLCLRTGNLQQAYKYYNDLGLKEINSKIDAYFTESMLIFHAYISLYVRLGIVSDIYTSQVFKNFRVKKFLNTFQFAFKEKKSRNLQIIILRAVFDILDSLRSGKIIELEYLEKYMRRHLKKENLNRSKLFIRGLIILSKKGLSAENICLAESKYVNSLKNIPFIDVHQDLYGEVVNFESLWSDVTEYCIKHL